MQVATLVNMRVSIGNIVIIVTRLVKLIIVVVVNHFLPPLLTAEHQEQDNEAKQSSQRDANGRQRSCPPGGVVQIAAVNDAVVERLQWPSVRHDLRLGWIGRSRRVQHAAECSQLRRKKNTNELRAH